MVVPPPPRIKHSTYYINPIHSVWLCSKPYARHCPVLWRMGLMSPLSSTNLFNLFFQNDLTMAIWWLLVLCLWSFKKKKSFIIRLKAHVSQLLVYRHPPASLFYTLLHPHQNFKIAKIFHYFQNIIVFTSFGTFKHQFYFSKHKTENYWCKNRGFDCRPTFRAFRTNRSFSWKLFCCKY